MYLEHSRSQ
jgi:hypothetical protein